MTEHGYWMPTVPLSTHAELTWQDIMSVIAAFLLFFVPIISLVLGLVSHEQARQAGLKQHAVGMVGLILGAIGCAGWALFWLLAAIGSIMGY